MSSGSSGGAAPVWHCPISRSLNIQFPYSQHPFALLFRYMNGQLVALVRPGAHARPCDVGNNLLTVAANPPERTSERLLFTLFSWLTPTFRDTRPRTRR